MVVNPCSHTVFDPLQLKEVYPENILVRGGESYRGNDLRPPVRHRSEGQRQSNPRRGHGVSSLSSVLCPAVDAGPREEESHCHAR